jgi:hypothetical protein
MNISESSVCVLISKGLQPDAARGASVPVLRGGGGVGWVRYLTMT